MAAKKHVDTIARLYVELNRVYDSLNKLELKLAYAPTDERHDAVSSALDSVSDACGQLSYVADAAAVKKAKAARKRR